MLVPTDLLNTPPAEIDVLFHLHGHGIGYREGIKDADDKSAPVGFAYKGKVRDEVGGQHRGPAPADDGRRAAAGHAQVRASAASTPPTMILEALHSVPGWGKVKPRRVVLGAYSGGGGSLPSVLGGRQGQGAPTGSPSARRKSPASPRSRCSTPSTGPTSWPT